jgi:hypothetical protein
MRNQSRKRNWSQMMKKRMKKRMKRKNGICDGHFDDDLYHETGHDDVWERDCGEWNVVRALFVA